MEGLAEIGPKPQKMVGAKSPDDPHRAAQVFEHKDLIVGGHIALFAVEHDRERLRMVPERLGQVPHRAAAVSIFAGPPFGGLGGVIGFRVQGGIDTQAGQQVDGWSRCTQGLPQTVITEPTVADDQGWLIAKMGGDAQDHLRRLRHL